MSLWPSVREITSIPPPGAAGTINRIGAQLVARSDVVLDNFAPGALNRLGLGYEWGRGINPGIIYCSVKGFLPGPYADRPFLDELAQMAGGLAYLTGLENQPMRAGASITDIGAASYGVIGILAALYRRQVTGGGERIESGLYETIVFWISQYITRVQMTGTNPPPRGRATAAWGPLWVGAYISCSPPRTASRYLWR